MEFIYATEAHFTWLQQQDKHIDAKKLLHKIQAQQILLVAQELNS